MQTFAKILGLFAAPLMHQTELTAFYHDFRLVRQANRDSASASSAKIEDCIATAIDADHAQRCVLMHKRH